MDDHREPPDTDELRSRAVRLLSRALDDALSADKSDVPRLRLGVEAALSVLMMHTLDSPENFDKSIRIAERALAAAEAGQADDDDLLMLGVHAAQLIAGLLDGVVEGVAGTGTNIGYSDWTSHPISEYQVDRATVAVSDLNLTSTEPSTWLLDDDDHDVTGGS